MTLIVALLISLVAGVVVYLIGQGFDKTPDNRWAGLAGLLVFVLVFLSTYKGIDF